MKHRYRILILGFILLLMGNLILDLVSPGKALAATSATVIDRSTITVGNKKFVDGDMDDNFEYSEVHPTDGCGDVIHGFNNDNLHPGRTPSSATIVISTPAGAGSSACIKHNETVTFDQRNNFLDAFAWIDSGTIKGTDGKLTFSKYKSSNVFVSTKDRNGCSDTLTVDPGNHTATLVARQGGNQFSKNITKDDYDWYPFPRPSDNTSGWKWNSSNKCWESSPVRNIHLSGDPQNGSKGAAATGSTSGGQSDNSCESSGGVLSWIICPILDMVDGGIHAIEGEIKNLLETKSAPFADDGNLHQAWGQIRNIAYIILLPIMLVMVIGTAIGVSGIDAYTVKRAMPRLLIAVIFITLSWSICTFMINLVNVIGAGIYGLLTYPFNAAHLPTSLADVLGVSGGLSAGAASALGFGGIIVASGGFGAAIGVILLYALSALLAIVIAFSILALRQMIIIMLVLLAPLAIIVWIFPGNDKGWKIWWDSFFKLLLMYPLIMVIFAASAIFGGIATTYQQGLLGILIGVTAYIAPFFLIPFTFRFAGGLFANISGFVNDKSRGLFDRSKKARQGIYSSGHERNMEAKNWIGTGRTGSMYRRAVAFGRNGSFNPTLSGRKRWGEAEKALYEKSADKRLEEGGPRAFNDDDASMLLRQRGMNRDKFISQYTQMQGIDGQLHTREEAESALHRAELAVGAKVGSTAMRVAAQKFRVAHTNTAYEPGERGLVQMQQELHEMEQDGLASAFDMAGWMKANRGRTDFSSNGFVDTVRYVQGKDASGRDITSEQAAASQLAGAFNSADPRDILGGHQRALESFADQAIKNLNDARQHAIATGDTEQLDLALADVGNLQTMLSSVSPKKANQIRDVVLKQGSGIRGPVLDPTTGGWVTVKDASGREIMDTVVGPDGKTRQQPRIAEQELSYRQLIEEARNDPAAHHVYHDRVREYSTARAADQAGRAAEAVAPPPETL